jgi:hypothetical protein
LLVHGFALVGEMWADVIPALADGNRVWSREPNDRAEGFDNTFAYVDDVPIEAE